MNDNLLHCESWAAFKTFLPISYFVVYSSFHTWYLGYFIFGSLQSSRASKALSLSSLYVILRCFRFLISDMLWMYRSNKISWWFFRFLPEANLLLSSYDHDGQLRKKEKNQSVNTYPCSRKAAAEEEKSLFRPIGKYTADPRGVPKFKPFRKNKHKKWIHTHL